MTYLLLIFFPVVMSVSSFLLRRENQIVTIGAVLTMAVEILLLLQLPIDLPSRLLGLTLALDPLSRLFLITFYVVAGFAFIVALRIPHGENFVATSLLMLAFTGATLLLQQEPFVATLLLISGGITAVLAIVDLPTDSPTLVGRASLAFGIRYLMLIVIAGVMMYLAFVLMSIYRGDTTPDRVSPAHLILGLLAVGFGLRLAVVPFFSWLPDLVEDTAPMVSVIVIAVVNITSLLFLITTFQIFPVIVAENEHGLQILQALGITTALLGGLFALRQPNIRRMLGFLVVYNAGTILFGLTTVTPLGLSGALFEAFNQIIVVMLLFLSLGMLELPDGRAPNVVRRDLLRRWPIASAGFLGGCLALIGLPPFNGFASKLLIYQAAAEEHSWSLGLLLLATGMALVAVLNFARERLFQPSEDEPATDISPLLGETELDRPAERRLMREPRSMAILTTLLLAICLAIGMYPQPVLATIDQVISGFTFVRAL